MQDAEAIERISARPRRGQGARQRPLRGRSAGRRSCTLQQGLPPAARSSRRPPARVPGERRWPVRVDVNLIATLMRSHPPRRRPRRSSATSKRTEACRSVSSRVRPRRPRGDASRTRTIHPRGDQGLARAIGLHAHRPRWRVGWRGAGPAHARHRPEERIAHGPLAVSTIRGSSSPSSSAAGRGARPVPDFERPGTDRADPRGPSR